MILQRNFKYRLYPTPEQETILLGWERTLRDLWNCAHQQRLMGLKRSPKIYCNFFDQCKEMTQCLEEFPWLKEVQCAARQAILNDLEKAWKSCFQQLSKKPRFKNKSSTMRIYAPSINIPFKLLGGRTNGILELKASAYRKLGSLKIVYHRPTPGKVTSWSIKRAAHLSKDVFQRFPYADVYTGRQVADHPGSIEIRGNGVDQRYVVNLFGQYYPGKPKNPDLIYDGFQTRERYFYQGLLSLAKVSDLESVAMPVGIGCGAAGGNWNTYLSLITKFANYIEETQRAQVVLYDLNHL